MSNFAIPKCKKVAIVLSLKNLKTRLAKKTISRRIHQTKRDAKFLNLEGSRMLMILFEFKDKTDFEEVEEFSEFLRSLGKQVILWGYYPHKNLPLFFTPTGNQQCLTQKQLRWFPIPCERAIAGFNEYQPDILIDLSREDCYPLKYLAAISQASMKVGCNSNFTQPIFDLLIQKDDDLPLTAFIENIIHYLNHLNKS